MRVMAKPLPALWMASGAVLWAAHFGLVYAFISLACARGLDDSIAMVVGGATAFAALVAVPIVVKGMRARAAFAGWMTASVAAIALVAILWGGLAVLLVPPCGLR